ncbi:hypothetical protein F511_08600 [Dorcoceras hygrometricum]|uniref:Uncharacterized protein n=1 Tax=Dorcoceras hygrometricum TaxID=472368 RepID=A0A2Z7BGX1_9LAMI|nr:hypothetical protein F511_08600 [Dorcoceras hygrometricum]
MGVGVTIVLLISLLGYLFAALRRVDSYHALMSLETAGYQGFSAGRGDDLAGGAMRAEDGRSST